MNNLLNIEERNELERCEVVIKQGLETFVEVGQALMLIREKKLYRVEYGTFKDYCEEKWGFKERRVYELMNSSKVIDNLENCAIAQVLPQNESQARPLTKLEPELQAEAWQKTVEQHGENITQKKVEEVVKEFVPINNELKQAKKEPMFAARTKEEILNAAKKKAEHEAKLLKDTKANAVELTAFVNPYDSNMFFLQGNYSESRFDDYYVQIEDDKYPTLTTSTGLFNADGSEYPLRFYSHVQTFPDDYKFCGPKTAIKTQIGNSVAPKMAEYISQFVQGETIGDLFGGCGGFSCGFHQGGFKTKWCIEWDKNAAHSFKLNYPESKVYNSNIVEFDTSVLEKVDVIIGGPPCKGFSSAGYRFKDDPRNKLYKEFLRVVKDLQPNQFVLENVLEMESIAEEVIQDFNDINYTIQIKKVHGNDIGMKQNRKRIFFIGSKNN